MYTIVLCLYYSILVMQTVLYLGILNAYMHYPYTCNVWRTLYVHYSPYTLYTYRK